MFGEDVKIGIENFNGTNFDFWRMPIEDYLYKKRLHLPLLGQKSKSIDDTEWNLLD